MALNLIIRQSINEVYAELDGVITKFIDERNNSNSWG